MMKLHYKFWTSISIAILLLTVLAKQVYAQNPDLTLRCENAYKQRVKLLGFNKDRTKVSIIAYEKGEISTLSTRFAIDVHEDKFKYSWAVPHFLFPGSYRAASIDRNSLRLTFREESESYMRGSTMLPGEDMGCEIENNNLIFLRALQDYNQYLGDLENQHQQRLEDRKF